jgi:hypothetical protein
MTWCVWRDILAALHNYVYLHALSLALDNNQLNFMALAIYPLLVNGFI